MLLSSLVFSQINVSTNFRVTAQLPIDTRFVFADVTARNALSENERYDGLLTYTVSEGKYWKLSGGITDDYWSEFTVIQKYKKEIEADDDVDITVPFVLNATAVVWFNGTPLQDADWSGSGTTTLHLVLGARQYDKILIIN